MLSFDMLTIAAICSATAALFWVAVALRLRRVAKHVAILDAATTTTPAPEKPLISVVVPCRNEARELPQCLRSLVAQDYEALEIVVIDDESTDGTYEMARAILRDVPRAKLLRGRARPNAEWVGKTWVVDQGVRQASGDWLLFLDSDILLHPSAIRRAFDLCCARKLAAVSIMPRIACTSFWDRLSMPLFALLSVLVHAPDANNSTRSAAARLAGAFILIRRRAYETSGGHHAVRSELVEDLALARNLKQAGVATHLTYTSDLAVTHMYSSPKECWQGLCRLTFPTLDFSVARLGVACGVNILSTLFPFVPLALLLLCGSPTWTFAGWAALGVTTWLGQPAMTRRVYRLVDVPAHYALLLPIAANLMCTAALASAYCHFWGNGIVWKTRAYPSHPGAAETAATGPAEALTDGSLRAAAPTSRT